MYCAYERPISIFLNSARTKSLVSAFNTEGNAELVAKARSEGRAISVSDGYIAATVTANGMMAATPDTAPFEAAGLKTVDSWTVQEATGAVYPSIAEMSAASAARVFVAQLT